MKKSKNSLLETLTDFEAGGKNRKKQQHKPFTTGLYKTFLHTARVISFIAVVVGLAVAVNKFRPPMLIFVIITYIMGFCGALHGINTSLEEVEKGRMP
ncbi:MAG: hypothetical protein DRO96_01555 [Candidatus Aenigmatarchaeota archaeon]|nr:MAG: hypothetical protein DRO96_01555 [Candidatus Aenigmarchaeota archaeon]